MTNRERIANMKMVDFYAKYYGADYATFTSFISYIISCEHCPCYAERNCTCATCYKHIDDWLDKECDD